VGLSLQGAKVGVLSRVLNSIVGGSAKAVTCCTGRRSS